MPDAKLLELMENEALVVVKDIQTAEQTRTRSWSYHRKDAWKLRLKVLFEWVHNEGGAVSRAALGLEGAGTPRGAQPAAMKARASHTREITCGW